MSTLEFNKNEDHIKLLISKFRRKENEIHLGGGKDKIKKQHKKAKFRG